MASFLLDSPESNQRSSYESQLNNFLNQNRNEWNTNISGDNAAYYIVLSVILMSLQEWKSWNIYFFKRILYLSFKKETNNAMELDNQQKSIEELWEICQPLIRLFRLVHATHIILKKPQISNLSNERKIIQHDSNSTWIVDMKDNIQKSGIDVVDAFASFGSSISISLLPIKSFDEMLDDCDLLASILEEPNISSVNEFIKKEYDLSKNN